MREALDELAEAFPVDEISDAPWVVERGSIAWMIREGDNGPQVGNFIIEADARWVAAARNAEAEARATPPSLDRRLADFERRLMVVLKHGHDLEKPGVRTALWIVSEVWPEYDRPTEESSHD